MLLQGMLPIRSARGFAGDAALSVTIADFDALGDEGGPFVPSSYTWYLRNSGNACINWTASVTGAWLDVSAASGTLGPGETCALTLTINATANAFSADTYVDTLTISDGTNSYERGITLGVSAGAGADPPPGEDSLTPIARWDTVPYQRINAGETLNVGVVAFSRAGIRKVRFTVTPAGGTYGGTSPIEVTAMTANPVTGVYEYTTPIAANDFSADGQVTINAHVVGLDWGVRDFDTNSDLGLEDLTITVNPLGSLIQTEAWVDTAGSDATGAVDNIALPFKSVAGAALAIQTYRNGLGRGNNADGGIIHVNEGTHTTLGTSTTITVTNEWLNVVTVGAKAATILNATSILKRLTMAHVSGMTLSASGLGEYSWLIQAPCTNAWVEDCTLLGAGRSLDGSNVCASTVTVWLTESTLTNANCIGIGSKFRLARNVTGGTLSNDGFNNAQMVVNVSLDDLDALETGNHVDAFQLHWVSDGPTGNVIVYNYRASDNAGQSIFVADEPGGGFILNGAALVNVYTDAPAYGQWDCDTDHLVLWNNTILSDSAYMLRAGITNLSMIGCLWGRMTGDESLDYGDCRDNHFVAGVTRGANPGTGAAVLTAYGKPDTGSPLIDRIDPIVVPVDAANTARVAACDVGAYEH